MSLYQLFPPLLDEEYAALEADIRKRGILIPVEKDDRDNILDGHNRYAIAQKLGIFCPVIVREFATEEDKKEHVLKINLARRHLDPPRWGEAFEKLLEVRGVKNGQGSRNDRSDNGLTSLTVREVAAEIGVPLKTAEGRLRKARALKALPKDKREQVQSGKRTLSQAVREEKRQQKLKTLTRQAAEVHVNGAACWRIVNKDCHTTYEARKSYEKSRKNKENHP